MLIKRLFDFSCALAGLLLLAPFLLVLAVLVRLDSPGPAFYLQKRVGKRGRVFRIVKFRTMHVAADRSGEITVGDDARVTRIGRVLRRFKIDELPQLLNVLRGEMSLVGPRPEVPHYVARYPDDVRRIVLSVPPGLTDWASIEFRHESDLLGQAADPERLYLEEIMPIKLDYYLRYVRERSFMLDLEIIGSTAWVLLGGRRHRHTDQSLKTGGEKPLSSVGGGRIHD